MFNIFKWFKSNKSIEVKENWVKNETQELPPRIKTYLKSLKETSKLPSCNAFTTFELDPKYMSEWKNINQKLVEITTTSPNCQTKTEEYNKIFSCLTFIKNSILVSQKFKNQLQKIGDNLYIQYYNSIDNQKVEKKNLKKKTNNVKVKIVNNKQKKDRR